MNSHHTTPESQNTLKLYISNEQKENILNLVKQLHPDERKRDMVKRYVNRTVVDFNIASPTTIDDAWEKCVKFANEKNSSTIFDFWIDLSEAAATNKITLNSNGSSSSPEYQHELMVGVYTALAQNLFTQFTNEADLLKCTQRLHEAIIDPSLINWKKIDTSQFIQRLKQEWTSFLPLIINNLKLNDRHLNTELLLSMGMSESDFINTFFSGKEAKESENDCFPSALSVYFSHCDGQLLHTFRQVSHTAYHMIETNNNLRINHRLFFVKNNTALRELIGNALYVGNDYFITDPGKKMDQYQYRVTSILPPHASVIHFGDEIIWDKIVKGQLSELKNKNDKTTQTNSNALNLFIPEKFKPQLLELFKQLYNDKLNNNERKRDILKKIITRSATDFGFIPVKKIDIAKEWQECIKNTEAKFSKSIFDFIDTLSKEIFSRFKFSIQGSWGAPEKEWGLSFAIYTALVQSLFDQFVHEPSLYTCTRRLNEAVRNHTVVNWKEIDKNRFNERLKEQWHTFRPLMYDHCLSSYFSSLGLLKGVGMNLNDFTRAFFSKELMNNVDHNNIVLPVDIIKLIANELSNSGTDLYKFRQICKPFYNVIENEDKFRINHRLYLISKDYILKELIGMPLFYGNDYLLSDPTNKINSYSYRVTSMNYPYQSVSYGGHQGQWDKMIGGYVFKDANGMLNILTAYRCEVYDGQFTVQQFKIDSLHELNEPIHFNRVEISHDRKSVINNYHAPIWDRSAEIRVDQGEVTVDVKFREGRDRNYRDFHFFGPAERHQAKFDMSDFDKDIIEVVMARKI